MAWTIFLVQNFEIQYFLRGGGGGVRKNEYFWGYEEIVDIFGRSLHYWTNWGGGGVFLYIFGVFLKAMHRMGIFFCGHKISNIYLGMPDMRDILMGKQ